MKRIPLKITIECELEWDPKDYHTRVTGKGIKRSFLRDLRYELTNNGCFHLTNLKVKEVE